MFLSAFSSGILNAPYPTPKCTSHCRKKDCTKNHIVHSTLELINPETEELEQTEQCRLELKHHKNAGRKGIDVVPIHSALVQPLKMLEQAARVLARTASCPTLFFRRGPPPRPYSEEYSSQAATSLLSSHGHHTTTTDVRHLFSTQFRNFRGSTAASRLEVELEEAAAALMGNSPPAWDATYDDDAQLRRKLRVLEEYPKFKEWVKTQAALHKQVKPRNPHEGT